MKRFIAFALVLCALLPMLFSCENKTYVELNGGTLDIEYSENTPLDEIVSRIPVRAGHVFIGWFGDASFTEYIDPQNITDAQRAYNRAYARWMTVEDKYSWEVRSPAITVTDISRASQKLDRIPITDKINMTNLKRSNCKAFKLTVQMSIRELMDGYQHVFIYNSDECLSNPNSVIDFAERYVYGHSEKAFADEHLLYEHIYAHSGKVSDPDWAVYDFVVTIPIDNVTGDLYIRYAASGEGDNDWRSRDVRVSVEPIF